MTDDSKRPGDYTPPPPAPQYQAAPRYDAAPPAGQGYGQNGSVPGKTLGIVSLVAGIVGFFFLAFVAPIVGIITGVIGGRQSKAAGVTNTPAKAGLIISIIALVLQIILTIVLVAVLVPVFAQCAELGPGEHIVDGVTYTCG
jgi:hypothetical protein